MNGDGELIPEEEQLYVWMIPYLNGLSVSAHERKRLKDYLTTTPINIKTPLETFDWASFFLDVKAFMGKNFFQFLMLLAGGISAFHYQKMLSVVGE